MKYMNVGKTAKPINTKGTMRRLFSFMKPYRCLLYTSRCV